MARYIGPTCRLCRAAGAKLFLKGDRCYTSKCAIERRNVKPGQTRDKTKDTEYAIQLKEKQKIKRIYGVLEKQFYNYYQKADNKIGITGDILMQMLERRLDNVVYRLGLAKSRAQSRQIVKHGRVLIDGKRVDIPSYQVSLGEAISLKYEAKYEEDRAIPVWLAKEGDVFKITEMPKRSYIDSDVNEQLVVEFYSR